MGVEIIAIQERESSTGGNMGEIVTLLIGLAVGALVGLFAGLEIGLKVIGGKRAGTE